MEEKDPDTASKILNKIHKGAQAIFIDASPHQILAGMTIYNLHTYSIYVRIHHLRKTLIVSGTYENLKYHLYEEESRFPVRRILPGKNKTV